MNRLYLTITLFFATIAAVAQVPTNGLVGWYPLDTAVNDLSNNNFHGTEFNTTYAADRFGNPNSAYNFDGASSFATLGDAFDYMPRTISVWFYARTSSNTNKMIYCVDNPNLLYGITNFGIVNIAGDTTLYSSIATALNHNATTLNEWHNVIIITNNNSTQKYIDGQLVSTDYITSFPSSSSGDSYVHLGTNRFANTEFFDGMIDNLRIYSRAVDSSEIYQLAHEGSIGIDETSFNKFFSLYPNPSNGTIVIEQKSNQPANCTLRIINTLSQNVFEERINQGTNRLTFDASPGVYMAEVFDDTNKIIGVQRLVVE